LKLGIIGLAGSGKSTVFKALTGGVESTARHGHQEPGLGIVKVEDKRVDFLADYHKPKKVTPAVVEYLDIPGISGEARTGRTLGEKVMPFLRPLDALVHCIRFFDSPALGSPTIQQDFLSGEEELILSDLGVVEKRIERIEKDVARGKKDLAEELELLREANKYLDEGKPLRLFQHAMESEKLKGFAFLSAKPELLLLNAGENKSVEEIESGLEQLRGIVKGQPYIGLDWLYADTEAEITRLSEEDAREFLKDLDLEEPAKNRIISKSFGLLDLIVFFTAGEPEVRAWQLKKGQNALKAAGTVHPDMERGFIRAEVVAYDDFKQAGSMAAAHKAGKVRLEGKDYTVHDGDIILFRFNI
jgi:GTP-binding protein YchF